MMKKIENIKWKEFFFTEVFTICSASSGIDKNKLVNKRGRVPYITRSEKNNGIDSFICTQRHKYKVDSSNVITVGLDTQTVFYQPSDFYTGQNIQLLKNNNLNKYIATFLIPLIKRQMEKFNWGGNGATLTRLRRSKIFLPITEMNDPDYAFMEAYMRKKEQEKVKVYKNYVAKRMGEIEKAKKVVPLSEKEWGEFVINKIFIVKSGKRLTKADMQKGKKPFVGSTDSNNGITEYVSNSNSSEDVNVLGVNYNGSVVENFYHPYRALFSDDVKRLSFREVEGNKFLYLFVKAAILKQKNKYQYGYKFNGTRMNKQKIMLPINRKKEPDYAYMENYMKKLELKNLTEYFKHRKK